MKIAFITSCAAPGQDGVGDYTRLLAQSCQSLGHPTRILALHDRHVARTVQDVSGTVQTLRLPARRSWQERLMQGREELETFAPDWISVQFVPYGFHRKGLSLRLNRRLQELTRTWPRQLMLHELWIGGERNALLKHRLIGFIQRRLVLQLIRRLSPRQVHTSNPTYRALLQHHHIRCNALPMFGALPTTNPNPELFLASLRAAKSKVDFNNRGDYWIFGFFGTLHPVWPPEPLFTHLQRAGQLQRKRILVAGVGRLGAGQSLWNCLAARYNGSLEFCHLGEQSPACISTFLSGIDFGITTTPLALIGKSATTAAMLEHGLPVIVNRDDVRYPHCPNPATDDPSLIVMDDSLPERLRHARRGPAQLRLPVVTGQFLDDLAEGSAIA